MLGPESPAEPDEDKVEESIPIPVFAPVVPDPDDDDDDDAEMVVDVEEEDDEAEEEEEADADEGGDGAADGDEEIPCPEDDDDAVDDAELSLGLASGVIPRDRSTAFAIKRITAGAGGSMPMSATKSTSKGSGPSVRNRDVLRATSSWKIE